MIKKCVECGREFVARSNSQKYCDDPHIRICPVCGKEYVESKHINLSKRPHACSYKCRAILRERTSVMRYGVTAPGNTKTARAKCKTTFLLKYGVTSPRSSIIKFKQLSSMYKDIVRDDIDLGLYEADIRRINLGSSTSITLAECVFEDHVTICKFSKWSYLNMNGVMCEVSKYYDIDSVYNLINAFLSIYLIDSVYVMFDINDKLIQLCKNLNLTPISVCKSKLIFKFSKF